MKTKRNKGKSLEIFVATKFADAMGDFSIRPTKASSGGSHNTEIGDVLSKDFFIECKNNKNNWFRKSIWNKLLNSLPLGTIKIPLYITKDEVAGILVMLTFEDFCKLIKEKV